MRNFVDLLIEDCNNTSLFFLGQAGFIIKSKNGKLLTIDPYLSNCVENVEGHVGFKRLLPVILEPNDIVFDYIITTHFHKDHFDLLLKLLFDVSFRFHQSEKSLCTLYQV